MRDAPPWLRALAILGASACALATSVPPNSFLVYDNPERPLLERDGLLVHLRARFPVAEYEQGDLERAADHAHADFTVRNTRGSAVAFTTSDATLTSDGETFANAEPVTLTLAPGETRRVTARFDVDYRRRRSLLERRSPARLKLGTATLEDGRRIELAIGMELLERR